MLAGLGGSLPGYIDGKQHWEGEETIVSTCKISNTTELSCIFDTRENFDSMFSV